MGADGCWEDEGVRGGELLVIIADSVVYFLTGPAVLFGLFVGVGHKFVTRGA